MLHKDNLTSVVDTWYNLSLRCVPQTPHTSTSAYQCVYHVQASHGVNIHAVC